MRTKKTSKRNGLFCAAGYSKEACKWGGEINLFKDGCYHRTVVTAKPVFATEKRALKAMKKYLTSWRARDLRAKKRRIKEERQTARQLAS
jgi:hypothetical protein